MIYQANDKYRALLRSNWISDPADGSILVSAVPDNVPTLVVVGWNTDFETVFSVEGKAGTGYTTYALTGVTRLRGYDGDIPENTSVNCLNNMEFINQYLTYLGIEWKGEWSVSTAYKAGEGVSYQGSSYVALVDTTGNTPPEAGKWQIVTARGATWTQGADAPDNADGMDGDFYLRTSNYDVYFKSGGTWSVSLNIKGVQGIQGIQGVKGDTGAKGDPGVVQAVIAGTNISINNTDPANPSVSVTGLSIDVQIFTTTGKNTWTKPVGAKWVEVTMMSAGGGGGSGRKGASLSNRYGGSGGGGGAFCIGKFPASVLSSTETVIVGAGGGGGSSQTTNSTNGNSGGDGGLSSFGSMLSVIGGYGGAGGTNNTTGTTTGGNGSFMESGGEGGGSSLTGNADSGFNAGGAVYDGYLSFSAGGGGGGGGIDSSNNVRGGGDGGYGATITDQTGFSGGAGGSGSTGGNGSAATENSSLGGGGGGGGGARHAGGNAYAGGNGGLYGGGGGGGGGATNDVGNSGAGGNGANGIVIVTTYF